MKTLIQGGTVITASETVKADVLIDNEKIEAVGTNFVAGTEFNIINATGKLVMPGGVDVHTHFDLPMFDTVSSDDHYTGHKAAAFGGTTTVMDFVSFDCSTLEESVNAWHEKADNKAAIDFGFHMNISRFDDGVARELSHLRDLGINSVKVFTAYTNRLRLNDGYIFKTLRIARDRGLLVMVHAENGDVIDVLVEEALSAGHMSPEWHALTRPIQSEVEAVYRSIKLAELADAPIYIVHMNTKGGVDHVREARRQGLKVMGETCPQYLFFTIDDIRRVDGSKWICSPPVRTINDNEGVWRAVADGTMQVMATDHCPFFFDGTKAIEYEDEKIAIPGKELGKHDFTKIPNGLPGVGDRMMIMWTKGVVDGRISANQFVEMNCTNPAKIFGMYPRKGTIMPGADADIAIWDPEKEFSYGIDHSHQRTDYNLYEGWKLKGIVEKVLLRGNLIVDDGRWLGRKGGGRFVRAGDMTVL
ncbi:MAG: dihydropyrimidinase [Chloroflexi bacterium]|nr:dihydropyrimidinase [Chloroflexota bacterium]